MARTRNDIDIEINTCERDLDSKNNELQRVKDDIDTECDEYEEASEKYKDGKMDQAQFHLMERYHHDAMGVLQDLEVALNNDIAALESKLLRLNDELKHTPPDSGSPPTPKGDDSDDDSVVPPPPRRKREKPPEAYTDSLDDPIENYNHPLLQADIKSDPFHHDQDWLKKLTFPLNGKRERDGNVDIRPLKFASDSEQLDIEELLEKGKEKGLENNILDQIKNHKHSNKTKDQGIDQFGNEEVEKVVERKADFASDGVILENRGDKLDGDSLEEKSLGVTERSSRAAWEEIAKSAVVTKPDVLSKKDNNGSIANEPFTNPSVKEKRLMMEYALGKVLNSQSHVEQCQVAMLESANKKHDGWPVLVITTKDSPLSSMLHIGEKKPLASLGSRTMIFDVLGYRYYWPNLQDNQPHDLLSAVSKNIIKNRVTLLPNDEVYVSDLKAKWTSFNANMGLQAKAVISYSRLDYEIWRKVRARQLLARKLIEIVPKKAPANANGYVMAKIGMEVAEDLVRNDKELQKIIDPYDLRIKAVKPGGADLDDTEAQYVLLCVQDQWNKKTHIEDGKIRTMKQLGIADMVIDLTFTGNGYWFPVLEAYQGDDDNCRIHYAEKDSLNYMEGSEKIGPLYRSAYIVRGFYGMNPSRDRVSDASHELTDNTPVYYQSDQSKEDREYTIKVRNRIYAGIMALAYTYDQQRFKVAKERGMGIYTVDGALERVAHAISCLQWHLWQEDNICISKRMKANSHFSSYVITLSDNGLKPNERIGGIEAGKGTVVVDLEDHRVFEALGNLKEVEDKNNAEKSRILGLDMPAGCPADDDKLDDEPFESSKLQESTAESKKNLEQVRQLELHKKRSRRLRKVAGVTMGVMAAVNLVASVGTGVGIAQSMKAADGVDGTNGEKGAKGDDGERGVKGLDGLAGETGNDGADGLRGDKGGDGLRGNQGDRGTDGEDGSRGQQGKKGDQGDAGQNGSDGRNGGEGNRGDRGNPGARGPVGDRGDKGQTGDQGPQGPQGPQGGAGSGGTDGSAGQEEASSGLGAAGAAVGVAAVGAVAAVTAATDTSASVASDSAMKAASKLAKNFMGSDHPGDWSDADSNKAIADALAHTDGSVPANTDADFFANTDVDTWKGADTSAATDSDVDVVTDSSGRLVADSGADALANSAPGSLANRAPDGSLIVVPAILLIQLPML